LRIDRGETDHACFFFFFISLFSCVQSSSGDITPRQIVDASAHLLSSLSVCAEVSRSTATLAVNLFKMGLQAARTKSERRVVEGAAAPLGTRGDNGRALAAKLAKVAAEIPAKV
jgi:hypothetical protein